VALVRAQAAGVYPYPFIDAAALGAKRVAVNILVLGALFLVLGCAVAALPGLRRALRTEAAGR
jgi:hypothetical protein